jgi:predicted RNA-binding Zn-ribbon protein involved in translation (DUF1610 family)
MIHRTYIECTTCSKPITARVQIGHEREQAHSFPCPHCGITIKFRFILDEPPYVKPVWEDNCIEGNTEGPIINMGAGFTLSPDTINKDRIFPSFELMRDFLPEIAAAKSQTQDRFLDMYMLLGGIPKAADLWEPLSKALHFYKTGDSLLLSKQLEIYCNKAGIENKELDDALIHFFESFFTPTSTTIFQAIYNEINRIMNFNTPEFNRFSDHYHNDILKYRIDSYKDIFDEYFRGYGDFNQTLLYLRTNRPLPDEAIATSSSFGLTKMFYGNAFETLGSHLDFPAALNNVSAGRQYHLMNSMDLDLFRTINKANRTKCFADNPVLSMFIAEYNSTLRNASHHRSFKLDATRRIITFRSGGTGALQRISYASYLYKCNHLALQLGSMLCSELYFLKLSSKQL